MKIFISSLGKEVILDTVEQETALIKELEALKPEAYAHLNNEYNPKRGFYIWTTEIRDAYWRRRRKQGGPVQVFSSE